MLGLLCASLAVIVCVKVCRLTTVVVLVIVNDQVKYLKGPTQALSLSLSLSLSV